MKATIKKCCAALLAGGFLLNAVGCGEKKNEYSDVIDDMGSIAEEDLPYGATIVQLSSSVDENIKMTVEYDNRFLTKEEATKISDYIAALNDCDAELMEQTVYPDYLSYLIETSDTESVYDYLVKMHDNIRDTYIGGEYEFNYVLINSCLDETASSDETGFAQLESVLEGISDETVSDKVTSRKLVGVEILYALNDDSGSYSLTYRTGADSLLYIYNIDGQLYIL